MTRTATYNPNALGAWWNSVQRADSSEWLRVSSEFGEWAQIIAGRDDIIGPVEPGKAHGAPGCYISEQAVVELNPDVCAPGVAPSDIKMDTNAGRLRQPVLAGVGFHEGGHAAFSQWSTRSTGSKERQLVQTALLLEETRMEKAILARHPENRVLLRAAATKLNLADLETPTTVAGAAHSAALLIGRVDAGVFDSDEMDDVENMLVPVMGLGRFMAFRAIWREAQAMDDHNNRKAMLAFAERWLALIPKDEQGGGEGDPILVCSMPGEPGEDGDGAEGAIAEALEQIAAEAAAEAAGQVAAAEAADAAEARAKEAAEQAAADHEAKVLLPGGYRSGGSGRERLGHLRPPTVDERARANRWGRAIRDAQHRERSKTVVSAAVPPGRLRSSAAVRRSAQRSMGIPVTVEPWRQTQRKHVENPPITVGIICDISGSMSSAAGPVASMAWSMSHAVHQNEGDTATVAYGNYLHPVVKPGTKPANVQTFEAHGGTEEFFDATRAIDGALDLATGSGVRMLVIVSDGRYRHDQLRKGEKALKRLMKAGVKVLWFDPTPHGEPIKVDGIHFVRVYNNEQYGAEVAKAITAALKAA